MDCETSPYYPSAWGRWWLSFHFWVNLSFDVSEKLFKNRVEEEYLMSLIQLPVKIFLIHTTWGHHQTPNVELGIDRAWYRQCCKIVPYFCTSLSTSDITIDLWDSFKYMIFLYIFMIFLPFLWAVAEYKHWTNCQNISSFWLICSDGPQMFRWCFVLSPDIREANWWNNSSRAPIRCSTHA